VLQIPAHLHVLGIDKGSLYPNAAARWRLNARGDKRMVRWSPARFRKSANSNAVLREPPRGIEEQRLRIVKPLIKATNG
jgi:hypothetical protein